MKLLLVYACLLFLCCGGTLCNIHRTISGNSANKLRRIKFPDELIEEIDDDPESFPERLLTNLFRKSNVAWFCAIPAAVLVGSTGILPLLVFKSTNCPEGGKLSESISPAKLRILLSFSVGGLFGDVFLHLLPESWMYIDRNDHSAGPAVGMWIIAGLICFLLLEKIFNIHEKMTEKTMEFEVVSTEREGVDQSDGLVTGARTDSELVKRVKSDGNRTPEVSRRVVQQQEVQVEREQHNNAEKKIMGYLNLLANCIDNFTHGLAVAGSFVVSVPVGICTTMAILLHEIPHEIGDFAVLLQAGFSRMDAAKGQILTASGALLGCLFGLMAESAGDASSWILPFTSGGFIYISCVQIIPDLVQETSFKESVKQMLAMFVGIGIMGLVSVAH